LARASSCSLVIPRAKRIGHHSPAFNAQGHFLIAQQAAIELFCELGEVDVLPDEHQLLTAVTGGSSPVFHDRRGAFMILRPLRFWHESPPAPGKPVTHQTTGLGP